MHPPSKKQTRRNIEPDVPRYANGRRVSGEVLSAREGGEPGLRGDDRLDTNLGNGGNWKSRHQGAE